MTPSSIRKRHVNTWQAKNPAIAADTAWLSSFSAIRALHQRAIHHAARGHSTGFAIPLDLAPRRLPVAGWRLLTRSAPARPLVSGAPGMASITAGIRTSRRSTTPAPAICARFGEKSFSPGDREGRGRRHLYAYFAGIEL